MGVPALGNLRALQVESVQNEPNVRQRAGCLVGFHSQSSVRPERFSVWLSKANQTYRVALRSTHLGVHFLTQDDLQLAEHFGTQTGDDLDKFAQLETEDGPGGVHISPQLRAISQLCEWPHGMSVEQSRRSAPSRRSRQGRAAQDLFSDARPGRRVWVGLPFHPLERSVAESAGHPAPK